MVYSRFRKEAPRDYRQFRLASRPRSVSVRDVMVGLGQLETTLIFPYQTVSGEREMKSPPRVLPEFPYGVTLGDSALFQCGFFVLCLKIISPLTTKSFDFYSAAFLSSLSTTHFCMEYHRILQGILGHGGGDCFLSSSFLLSP